jgi:hypothetical protein
MEAHRVFIARRRKTRPTEEYRAVTTEERDEFLGHFERRKLALEECGRAYGTDCHNELACVRCPFLIVSPTGRPRLEQIRDNLAARIAEAEHEGWHGEVNGLDVRRRRQTDATRRQTTAQGHARSPGHPLVQPNRRLHHPMRRTRSPKRRQDVTARAGCGLVSLIGISASTDASPHPGHARGAAPPGPCPCLPRGVAGCGRSCPAFGWAWARCMWRPVESAPGAEGAEG